MQIEKQGYKYTEEFGYIPEDWEVKPLESYVNKIGDIDHYMPPTTNYGIPYIMTGDFIGNNELDYYGAKKVSFSDYDKLSKKIKPEYNDIIIARYASVGEIRIVKSTKPFLVSYSCAIIKTNKNLMNPNYLAYYMKSDLYQNLLALEINASTQKNIGIDTLKTISVLAPINKIEQEKIAEVLEDVDSLIDNTQQLINKKKDLKTATMQKLLTPKEDWVEKKLGDICSYITTGKLDANAMVENGEYRFYTCAKEYYKIDTYAFEGESLLVSGNGANVGYIHYYNGKFNAYQRTYVLQKFSENIFYIKCFMDKFLSDRIASEVNAGNTPYIKLDTITDMLIKYPKNNEEQEKIATILSDMDSEIEALEKELNKYKNLKTGMMQQLLTGKIRLIGKKVKPDSKVVDITSVKQQNKANDEFKDAILISMLAYKFGSQKYPLGAFRRQKLSYLFKRHNNIPIDEYMKKAMGPYNPKMKYQGAEGIALRNKYVRSIDRGLVATNSISKAEEYYNRYYQQESLSWLDTNFHYESNNNLEVLTTVDYAIVDLRNKNREITLENIKSYIVSDEEWKPKLDKDFFTDEAIIKAMETSRTLLNSY